ncbi:MAG: retroviral-like aspartic protease family protein, partial [Hyphomonadaceae bacterium]|nr:retroviral-like aspartic protease family protein [Hyphomonadaceae bacterium]
MDINATLDTWVDAYGRPAARVMLNGKGPFSFMVDTGSTTTVLAQRHIAAVGAPITGMATVAGTTGMAETQVAQMALIEVGAVNKRDVRVAVLPDEHLTSIDGILGADVFAGKRVEFDIPGKSVRIESSRRPTRSTRGTMMSNMNVRRGLLAEIEGRVGNVGAKLMLDTGAQNCIANTALSDALLRAHPRLERVENMKVFGVTGHVLTGQYIALPRVGLRAFSVKDAGAVAVDAPIFDLWGLKDEPAMIVGMNLLSRLRSFSIDYGAKAFDAQLLSDLIARKSVGFG